MSDGRQNRWLRLVIVLYCRVCVTDSMGMYAGEGFAGVTLPVKRKHNQSIFINLLCKDVKSVNAGTFLTPSACE